MACAGGAAAQAPQWETNGPAKTQWAPFPSAAKPAKASPLPVPAAIPLLVPAAIPVTGDTIGTRVILFQKPAETPVDPKMPAEGKPPVPTKGEPSSTDVFRMGGDDTLRIPKESEIQHRELLAKIAPTTTPVNPAIARIAATPPRQSLLEPGFVVHRKLFFEEKNSERYGWSLGMAQPLVSAAYFYKDLLLWPTHMASNFRERYSTNAGKFLPGSPVPYYLYPPEVTLFGLSIGTAAILGVVFLFP